jgi:hypothetical protein
VLGDVGQFPARKTHPATTRAAPGSAAPGLDHLHSSLLERHVIVRAFAGGHPLPSCPGPGGSSSTGTGGNGNRCGVAQDPAHGPAGGAARVPAAEHGDRHDRYRCHSPSGTGRRTRTSQHAACPAAPGQSAAPGLVVTSCRSQRRCSSGRDSDACVTAGQTAIVRWILPLRMPLTECTFTGFDSNYVSDLGGAKRARTADLLHAMGNAAVHLPLDASQRRPVMLNRARTTFKTTVRSRSKDLETTTDHMITSYPGTAGLVRARLHRGSSGSPRL